MRIPQGSPAYGTLKLNDRLTADERHRRIELIRNACAAARG